MGSSERGRFNHIVGLNIDGELPVKDFQRCESPQRVIDLIGELGGVAILAHPYWSELNINDMTKFEAYIRIEITDWNCKKA